MRELEYPDQYPELDEDKIERIMEHCEAYEVEPVIIDYYENWDDFASIWCEDTGCTKADAFEKLYEESGEFIIFPDWGILRAQVD